MFKKNLFSLAVAALAFSRLSMAEEAPAAVGKRVSVCEKSWDEKDGTYGFKFSDGHTIDGNLSDFNADIQKMLALHGLSQKVGDSYAGVKGDVASAKTNAQAMVDQLKAGEWKGERGGDAGPRLGELAEAIAEIKGVDYDRAYKAVEAASDDDRKAWRANAKVKATIAAQRAAKAQKALESAASQELEIDLA